MFTVSSRLKVFLYLPATDMRKSFDGLAAIVEHALSQNIFEGHLFVFRNRRGDRVKLLYWDGDGLAMWCKRLEKGTFRFPASGEQSSSLTISAADLTMLLDGVDLTSVKRRKRYQRSA
jgi:transposase